MDEALQLKASHFPIGNIPDAIPLSDTLDKFYMGTGQFEGPVHFDHRCAQQEVCVVERTFRQEALGENLKHFGLQGPHIKSVRADIGNSLLALVPSPQLHVRSSCQPAPSPQATVTSSTLQACPMGSFSSAGSGSWFGHISNISASNHISIGGCSLGPDSSSNILELDMNLARFRREVNLPPCSRMAPSQDWFETSVMRSAGSGALKQSGGHGIGNELTVHNPLPERKTEAVSRRQQAQSIKISPIFPSNRIFTRASESFCDSGTSQLPPLASFGVMVGRVVCTNYNSGERSGGELCLTQLGLLGVICSCHGYHMSVAKFTQHVGLFCANPGNAVLMEGSGESLIQWRRMFFSPYGVKIPDDDQGWDWTKGDLWDCGPPKYQAVVTQSWHKEVDVSCNSEPVLTDRAGQVWDASLSPVATVNLSHSSTNMCLPSSLGEGNQRDSRKELPESFVRTYRGNSVEFGLCLTSIENLSETVGRSQESVDQHSLITTQSTEFFNSISGGQQFVSAQAVQQVAAEHPWMTVSSRTALKGLNLNVDDGRQPFEQEKDRNVPSSFELRLGQPCEKSQPIVTSLSSSLASQMQRVVQRVADFEDNGSCLLDHSSVKRIGEVSECRHSENCRGRDNLLCRDTSLLSTEGMWRWSGPICMGRTFKSGNGVLMNCECSSKHSESELQNQIVGAVQSLPQRWQDLDLILDQGWMSNTSLSQKEATQQPSDLERRKSEVCCREKLILSIGESAPICREAWGLQHCPCGHMDVSNDVKEGWGCDCFNCVKASAVNLKGRRVSNLGEYADFCMKKGEGDGNQVEPFRPKMIRDGGHGSTNLGCSSSIGCCLRLFQAPPSQSYSCGGNSVDDLIQGPRVISLGGSSPTLVSAIATDSGIDKRCNNSDSGMVKSGARDCNETLQWKEMASVFLPQSETMGDTTRDDILPWLQLEAVLTDTAGKSHTCVIANSGVSQDLQPMSNDCSKCYENILSRSSEDGMEGVSNDRNAVQSEVIDESSGICKYSSEGVDRVLGVSSSSKDEDVQKYISPSSKGFPSSNNAEGLGAKLRTQSRVSYNMKDTAGAGQVEEHIPVNIWKVEKKQRTMKYKRLDASIGVTEIKKQKLSATVNLGRETHALPGPLQETNTSSYVGSKINVVELTPSTLGKPDALNYEQAKKSDVTLNNMNAFDSEERFLKKGATHVGRVPCVVHCKKVKRAKVKEEPDMTSTGRSLSLKLASLNDSSIRESAVSGCSIPKSATLSTISCEPVRTANLQSVTIGQVILGRPSPRNARRMVSLNAIMRKPVVVSLTVPTDGVEVVACGGGCSHPNILKASNCKVGFECCKDDAKLSSLKDFKVSQLCDGLKSSLLNSDQKSTSIRERLKVSSPKDGQKFANPNMTALREGRTLPVASVKSSFKLSSPKEGCLVSCPIDSLRVSSTKDGSGVSFPVDDFKEWSPMVTRYKNSAEESYVESCIRIPSAAIDLESHLLSDGLEASFNTYCSNSCAPPKTLQILVSANDLRETNVTNTEKVTIQEENFEPADDLRASVSMDGSKPTLSSNVLKPSVQNDVCKPIVFANEMEVAAPKERLKALASKNTLKDFLSFDPLKMPASQGSSNGSAFKESSKAPATMVGLNVPSKAKEKSKCPKKLMSSVSDSTLHDKKDNNNSTTLNTFKETGNVSESHEHQVCKVRSIEALIAERKLDGPGLGIFEVHGKLVDPLQVMNQEIYGRTATKSALAFSVPLHFTNGKCFVPRGERSPRGNLANVKNMCSHEGCDGHKTDSRRVPDTVRRSLDQIVELKAARLTAAETWELTNTKVSPVRTQILIPEMKINDCRKEDSSYLSTPVNSSVVASEELDERGTSYTKPLSLKRGVGDPEIFETPSSFKKQKLVESNGILEPRSEILEVRCSLPRSISAAPACARVQPELTSIKRQVIDTDLKTTRSKKRCPRPKWSDYRVPEGVVECCVCGSSISEFFNQLVCCVRCPVKVHQACYGVKKIPNSAWLCRTCKADATHPVCVLCGYGGGAMTRARKANGFVKGLVKAWQEKVIFKEIEDVCTSYSTKYHENCVPRAADHLKPIAHVVNGVHESKRMNAPGDFFSILFNHSKDSEKCQKPLHEENWIASNSVTSGVVDLSAVQWVHMVCALWMPGTRCLNFGTMGVFDVSGVAQARRKLICSVCGRRGGACIQCRETKCGIPFHAWCAHQKGLLQSEIVHDESDQVGFYGKCLRHGNGDGAVNNVCEFIDNMTDVSESVSGPTSCARTEGYKGKLTLQQRAVYRRNATRNGSVAVSPEQVAAWLRINERKTLRARRFTKSANSDQKTNQREYLRFKQEQRWRQLCVFKSGIHALGLYTCEFISRGEMVVEYIGEVVGLRVADKREADYHSGKQMQYQGACYLFRIDKEWIIDATRKGGIARFVNHSCAPNCVAKVIPVKNQNKVVFFAQQDIYAGEEITYDYQFNFEQEGDKIPCFCGSANCRGTLN